MPKVSVIVPVYNTEKYLRDCLDSLVSQSLDDMEIIVVDDASTDNGYEIIEEYALKYPQLKVYHNDKNIGQSMARNIGLEMASGEYIGFVDSDDFIEKTMYETMYEGAIESGADVVSVGIDFIDSDVNRDRDSLFKARWKGNLVNTYVDPMQVYWESPSCCNKIFKRELIGDYRFLEGCIWEDVAFTYSMLMKADSILSFPDNFYKYRRDVSDGVSSLGYSVDAPLDDVFRVCDEVGREAIINGKAEIFKDVIPLLQTAICFQRLKEIKSWDASLEVKNDTMVSLYNKVLEKYGDPKNLDDGLLSAKADIFLINEVRDMALKSNGRSI